MCLYRWRRDIDHGKTFRELVQGPHVFGVDAEIDFIGTAQFHFVILRNGKNLAFTGLDQDLFPRPGFYVMVRSRQGGDDDNFHGFARLRTACFNRSGNLGVFSCHGFNGYYLNRLYLDRSGKSGVRYSEHEEQQKDSRHDDFKIHVFLSSIIGCAVKRDGFCSLPLQRSLFFCLPIDRTSYARTA